MPKCVHDKCMRCGKWDFFIYLADGRYKCKECEQKDEEIELEALSNAAKAVKWND